jgi:hypothetical protein
MATSGAADQQVQISFKQVQTSLKVRIALRHPDPSSDAEQSQQMLLNGQHMPTRFDLTPTNPAKSLYFPKLPTELRLKIWRYYSIPSRECSESLGTLKQGSFSGVATSLATTTY